MFGFPRTRGDGPCAGRRTDTPNSEFPPHARGWTRSGAHRQIMQRGDAAHQGARFPRTRGDGPRHSTLDRTRIGFTG